MNDIGYSILSAAYGYKKLSSGDLAIIIVVSFVLIFIVFPIFVYKVLKSDIGNRKSCNTNNKQSECSKTYNYSTSEFNSTQFDLISNQIEESFSIMNSSSNPDTFFSRLNFILERTELLYQLENDVNIGHDLSKSYKDYLDSHFDDMLADCFNKYLDKARRELKTESGIQKRIQNFWSAAERNSYKSTDLKNKIDFISEKESKSRFSNYKESDSQFNNYNEYDSRFDDYKESDIGLEYYRASQRAHEKHVSQYKNLKFNNVSVKNEEIEPLTSTERYFLKALSGQFANKLDFPIYWTCEYNIDYENLIWKLLENGYVRIGLPTDDLSFLTVKQLKEVLKYLSLPVSGKKQELIDRLLFYGNIDNALQALNLYDSRFVLTPLGKEATETLPRSITKNLEFEDKCIRYIMQLDFNEAYKEMCRWQMTKQRPYGVGIDWEHKLYVGISKKDMETYLYLWKLDISGDLTIECIDYMQHAKACIIFGFMMGASADKVAYLMERIIPNLVRNAELVSKIQKILFLM